MDVQDHKKSTSSVHEIHGLHICHKCGWPFPNPHPSAKHRRAHKRVCGMIEGYRRIDSGSDHANLGGSDNEQNSDDEHRTPSPKVEKGSIKELGSSGGIGLKSSRSEDELFSDAVTDFSDNGVSPSLEMRLESVKQLGKNVRGELSNDLEDNHVSEDLKAGGTSQPLHGSTQLPQGPEKASEMSDSDVVGSERNLPEISKSIGDVDNENVSVGVSSTNGLEFDSSRVVSEVFAVSDKFTTESETGTQNELISSGLGTDIKEKEKGNEAVDVHCTAASEVLQSQHKLEIEPKLEEIEGNTSGPAVLEAMALETSKETSDMRIGPDFLSKLSNVNGQTSHAGIVDETADQEKELTTNLQSKHDVTSPVEPPKLGNASVVSDIESDSSKNLFHSSDGKSNVVCDLKEAGNEDAHLLSVANTTSSVVENPEVMVGDFKDYKVLKTSFPLDLGAAEEIRSTEDDKKVLVPENLPSAFSNHPAGSIENSSSDLEVDLEKQDVSTVIGGEVGSSAPENLPGSHASVPAENVDNSSLDSLEDDIAKDGFPTSIDGEVGEDLPSVPSSFPADHSSSEALEDDHTKESISTSIGGEAGTSAPENLLSAMSSVPAGTADNSSSSALEDDLKKKVVSTPVDEEVGTSASENLPRILSSVPAETGDSSSPEALKDDFKEEEGISTPLDGEVGNSENIALSNIPAGTADNSSSDALQDDLTESVSTAMDCGVGTSVPEGLSSALSNVPVGTVDDFVLEDDLKKEAVSTPLDWEVGSSGFRVTSNEHIHSFSVAETFPAVENPKATIGDFADNKALRSGFPVDLGAAEEIRSTDKKVTVPEILPSALSDVPAGSIDNNSPSDDLEDEESGAVSIPIDGEIGASDFRVTNNADFGSSGSPDYQKASISETNNSEPNDNLERSLPQFVDGKSLQKEDSEPTTGEHSDLIPLESPAGELICQTTNLYGGENANDYGIDTLVYVATENGNTQAGNELPSNITTTLAHVEAIPEPTEKSISLTGDDSLGHEKSSMYFSSNAGNETVEVAAEEKLLKQTDFTHESTQQLTNSASLNEARASNQVDIDVRDSGKLSNTSESPSNAFEGLKIVDETEVRRSSFTPCMVSEPNYEDPNVISEKTSEDSNSKEIAAVPLESEFPNKNSKDIEDVNTRDAIVSGLLLDAGQNKVKEQNFSTLAVDNSIVSSSRTDSLEGNWGSVSVLSTQSDVTAVADSEVQSSTDTQAAEKLEGEFKKPQAAATESHPDRSDVFEPPSFMTLVESGVGVNKNAAASEIRTAQRDEQTKSESVQAGWFPSITNVVNESEGRKKNEEIIAKVTNWSTGKQHSPLKNLLSEAHAETKVKLPNTKQVPAVSQADDTTSKNSDTAVTTVSSILGSELPTADTVKKEMEKEWNSPARYPIQIKKEKRKGRPYWVPFVCCTSVHQDV